MITPLDLCVASLRKGHATLLCIVRILTDDPRRGSEMKTCFLRRTVIGEPDKLPSAGEDDTSLGIQCKYNLRSAIETSFHCASIRSVGHTYMEARAREQEVPRGFDPRSLDSESRVLTVTPRDQVKLHPRKVYPLYNLGN